VFNIGTGKGSSVLDIVHAYEKACGKKIPYVIGPRRAGDLATVYADTAKANRELGFRAEFGLDRMCADSWRWQTMNPMGFGD
jgi:UDP-glucose 4-epimerase